ncbi:MAG: glycosyl hydrolase [Opitutus sp.]
MNHFRLLLIVASIATAGDQVKADPLYEAFRNPAATTRPMVRWWWNGGRVNATELVRELDVLKAAGIGGVEINTIGMPEGASAASLAAHPEVAWLSPEWCELVRITAQAAHDRGMTADLIVGSGWPFGGGFLAPTEQTQRVLLTKRVVTGPVRLSFTRPELEALRPPSKKAESPEESQPPTRSELYFLRLLPATALSGEFSAGRDLLTDIDAAGRVVIDVPAGEHLLYIGAWQMGFTHVKLGAPGADGPVVNHFDAHAVKKYLDHMSTQLAPALGGHLGGALRATFVDSLELDHANWTGDFAAEFTRRRGYDVQPYLPFVLDTDAPISTTAFNQTVRRARYDFDRTLLELFDERFLSTYVAWAKANGLKARIQAYGRETHPLHGSMKVDLPEGETWLWLDRFHPERIRVESAVVNKYVSSAANLTGQRLRSFEAMTNAVPVFRETLQDFKRGFDATLLDGLNQPILHGFNYTPLDVGFPGWIRFGSYLNERTPFWRYFPEFTEYAARLGTVMRSSTAHARIAVLAPRPDEWARHGLLYQPFPELADPWYEYKLMGAIQQAGYNVDYVSEEILTRGKKSDGQLRFGPCAYDVLVLEDVTSMEPAAAAALADFAASGGQVVFIGAAPVRSPGLLNAVQKDAQVNDAVARIRSLSTGKVRDAISPAQPLPATEGGEEKLLLEFAAALLRRTGLTPDVVFDTLQPEVSQISQRDGERSIYFLANHDARDAANISATFPGAKGRPYLWNPLTGERSSLNVTANGRLRINLGPVGSALIVFDPAEAPVTVDVATGTAPEERELRRLSGPWQLELAPANSAERKTRTLSGLLDLGPADDPELSTFGGIATYAIEFDGSGLAGGAIDLGEVRDISEVTLNGVALGTRWFGRHRYELRNLRPGVNQLQIKVATVLVNLMRSKVSDRAAQRWASWAPPISTGMLGPVRILADAAR